MNFEDQTGPTKREELNPKIMEEVLAQPIVKICRDPETKEKIFIVTESELRDKVLFPVSTRGSTQYTSPGIPSLRSVLLLNSLPLPAGKKATARDYAISG